MQKISKSKYGFKFYKPASEIEGWTASLPIGNGKVGALLQGGVRYEKIMISSSDSYWKGFVGVLPDVSEKIKEARKLVKAKNPTLAGESIEKGFAIKKYFPSLFSPVPIADLIVEQSIGFKHVSNYVRSLNLETEEVGVSFSDSGTKVERSIFASFANNLIFYEISRVGTRPLNVSFKFLPHDLSTKSFNGVYAGDFKNVIHKNESNFLMYGIEDVGLSSGVVAKIFTDNKATYQVVDEKLTVDNAEKILVVIAVYNNKTAQKGFAECKELLNNLKNVAYDKCFKDHLTAYKKQFGKCELSLSNEKDASVENLMSNFSEESTLIYEKLFYYAKYLNVVNGAGNFSSLLKTGLWSYHYANNDAFSDTACSLPALHASQLQMGMESLYLAQVDYFKTFEDDLKKNAVRVYKSRGFMVPYKFVYGSCLPASTCAKDISVVVSGAVIANYMYDYFLYTLDVKFLKNVAIPFMKECINFYIEYFTKDDEYKIESCPSFSPMGTSKYYENKNIGVYNSCSCDFTVVRSLIQNVISSCSNYSIALPEIVEYQNFLNKIPAIKTEGGAIAEYNNDDNSNKSAGFLHLYPVFGSREIYAKSSPAKISAYLSTVVHKIGDGVFAQNIISLGRLAEVSSLLGQGEACLNILRYMISNFLSKNMFFLNYDKNNMCAYVGGDNYFNIAGNQLLASSIMSSIVSENNSTLSILAARPAVWKSGKIENLCTRKNVIIDVEWDDKKGLAFVRLKANRSAKFNVALFAGVKKVKNYVIDSSNPIIENISLSSGKSLVLEIKY